MKIIVATDIKNGIGKDNKIPWHLPDDLRYFKSRTTSGRTNAIIMGRKTWDSIKNKPLEKRINIVISKTLPIQSSNDDFYICRSFESAKEIVDCLNIKNTHVIGGSDIYKLALDSGVVESITMTNINNNFDCDTFFPQLNENYKFSFKSKKTKYNNIEYFYSYWVKS